MVTENIAPPKGVTKINTNTLDNVGKIFGDLDKFIKKSGNYINDFNKSLNSATLSVTKFKKEYVSQYRPLEKELVSNISDAVEIFEENSNRFQDFLKMTDEKNVYLRNFMNGMDNMRDEILNQSVSIFKKTDSFGANLPSLIDKTMRNFEMPDLDTSKLLTNVTDNFENSFDRMRRSVDVDVDVNKNGELIHFLRDYPSSKDDKSNDKNRKHNKASDNRNPKLKELAESIKADTEKQMLKVFDTKYLDGMFAKENEFNKMYNAHLSEIEKLKLQALEVYGEGFENTEQFKNALMNLEKKESFKRDSSDNKVKYLDNKFAVGTNYAQKQNEYQDEIEKLKTQALETYGEGFEQNKEYQMAMQNLEKKYEEEMHKAKIDDFKEKHEFLGKMYDTISNSFKKNEKSLRGVFGPLNLLFAPFEEFFGGSVFKLIGKGMKSFFGIFRKKRPTASDVAKSGGAGVGNLYVANKIDELIKLQGGDGGGLGDLFGGDKGGLLSGLLGKGGGGGLMKMIGGNLPLAGGIASLAIGLIWAVIDGIKGAIQAEEWGVSKFGGFLGGFFGGDADGGIKNAFKNAGKWALIGAGVGTLICPVVGTIAGGLIGAALGGVLGAIGGKKLAKGFDKIGVWLKENIWEPIKQFFFNIFDIQKFIDIWKGEGSIVSKIGKTIGQGLITLVKLPFKALIEGGKLVFKIGKSIWNLLGKLWDKLKEWLPKLWEGVKEFFGGLWDGLKNTLLGAWEGIKNVANKVWGGLKEGASKVWNGTKKVLGKAWDGVKNVTGKVWNGIKDGASKAWNGTKKVMSKAWNGVKNVTGKVWGGMKKSASKVWNGTKKVLGKTWDGVKNVTEKAWNGIKDGTKKAWDSVKDKTSKAWDGVKNAVTDIKEDFAKGGIKGVIDGLFEKLKTNINKFFKENPLGIWLDSHIITPIKDFFSSIGNFFSYVSTMWSEHGGILSIDDIVKGLKDKDSSGKSGFDKYVEQKDKVVASSLNVEEWFNKYKSDYNIKTKKGKVISKGDEKDIVNAVVLKLSENPSLKYNDALKEVLADKKFTSTFLKVNDAIIRPNGDIIKTDPKDTIVALKDIPNAMNEMKNNIDKRSVSTINNLAFDDSSLEKKLTEAISLLKKIAEKNLDIQLPQQTRMDMDLIMNGGLI